MKISTDAKRRLVVAALCSLSLLLYIDRVCISSAKKQVSADLGLSNQEMGWVFGAFTIGYALAQIPSGYLADKYGPRRLLAGTVTAWSFFTAVTGLVHSFGPMVAVRFLFGIGESGAFPGSARVFFAWLKPGQRGFANGLLFSGSRIGGALAFLILPGVIQSFGWRSTFFFLGAIGVVWAVIWYLTFRDTPPDAEQAPAGSTAAAEPPKEETLEVAGVFRSRALVLSMLQYFASNFTFFIGLSWMLPYLQDRFNLTPVEAGHYAMVPLVFAAMSQWVSGYVVDRLYRSRFSSWSRRLPAALGFAVAAVGIAGVTQSHTVGVVVACFTLAIFGADMTISPSWTYCVDLGRKASGTVSGAMNMAGNLGSFISSITFPFLAKGGGDAASYFWLAAGLNVVGTVAWLYMTPPAVGSKAAEAAA